MKFEETYLNDNILDALYDMHFDEMTPIQERCIPEILDGYDVLGVAQTGTGKTAAYLLPILSQLDDGDYPKDAINCVVMSPTRELAQQIDQAMQGFGYYLDEVSSVAVYGGNDGGRYDQELKGMRLGADVLIAQSSKGRKPRPLTLFFLRARRGRPYARHGFYRRYHEDREGAARQLSACDVLCHHAAEDP